MENFNKKIRNHIFETIENYNDYCLTLDQAIVNYAIYFLNNMRYDDPYKNIYIKYASMIMFLDTYKILSHKNKENTISDEEMGDYHLLKTILSYDELQDEICSNFIFLIRIIKNSYEFYNMSGLGKVNLIQSLSDGENAMLNYVCPIHKYDLEYYKKDFTLEEIMKNYNNQKKYQRKHLMLELEITIMENITNFIRNLCKNDYEKASKLLYEIAQKDYAILKQLKDKIDDEEIKERIFYYDKHDSTDILWRLEKDEDFLTEAISNLASFYIDHEYQDVPLEDNSLNQDDIKIIQKKFEFEIK